MKLVPTSTLAKGLNVLYKDIHLFTIGKVKEQNIIQIMDTNNVLFLNKNFCLASYDFTMCINSILAGIILKSSYM